MNENESRRLVSGNASSRILRLPEVIARVGLCRASIYQYIDEGNFPKQVLIGKRACGWLEGEIEAWIAARINERQSNRL